MGFEQIFPHVYALRGGYVNIFAIAGEDGVTLIDSGLKGAEKAVFKALAGINRKPGDIRSVLVTHHHADHVGALAAIRRAGEAKVYVHATDAPIVAGERPRPPANRASLLGRTLGPLLSRLPQNNPPPAPVDVLIGDGDVLPVAGGMKVLHTPGHTLGSVSFLMEEHGGVLFAGDAAANIMGRLGGSPPIFTEDVAAAKASLQKLAALEFDTACFGHGRVLRGRASAAFRRWVERHA